MTPAERSILTENNNAYKEKFGFPFVICARENKKKAILDGISTRVNNPAKVELQTGITEVKKIAFYRLDAIIEAWVSLTSIIQFIYCPTKSDAWIWILIDNQ